MSEHLLTARVPDAKPRSRFFLWFGVLVAVLVLVGFGRTTLLPLLQGVVPHDPWYLYVHAASLFIWTGLLLLQPSFVAGGRTDLHRRVGLTALLVVPAGTLAGIVLVMERTKRAYLSDPMNEAAVLLTQFLTFAAFAAFATAALLLTRRSDWHKRLMAFSSLVVLDAAVGRIPVLGEQASTVTLLLGGAILVNDLVATRRVHIATIIGMCCLVAIEWVGDLLGTTTLWQRFARTLLVG